MLIDGNDTRGIDTGIMTTTPVEIIVMRRNVDEPDPANGRRTFLPGLRRIQLPASQRSDRLGAPEHFKSQIWWWGPKQARQAQKVRDIVDGLNAGANTISS